MENEHGLIEMRTQCADRVNNINNVYKCVRLVYKILTQFSIPENQAVLEHTSEAHALLLLYILQHT